MGYAVQKVQQNTLSLFEQKLAIMKITLDIQESKLAFFLELIKNFSFVKLVKESEVEALSPAHKSILDERLSALETNSESLLDWDEVQAELEQMP